MLAAVKISKSPEKHRIDDCIQTLYAKAVKLEIQAVGGNFQLDLQVRGQPGGGEKGSIHLKLQSCVKLQGQTIQSGVEFYRWRSSYLCEVCQVAAITGSCG